MSSGRPIKWTPDKLKKLGKELCEFCEKPDVFHISAFEIEKGFSVGYLKWLAKDHELFSPILRSAKHILGHKIVKIALEGKGNNFVINRFVPMYLKDVDDFEEYKKEKDLDREIRKEKAKSELAAKNQTEAASKLDAFIDYMKDKKSDR